MSIGTEQDRLDPVRKLTLGLAAVEAVGVPAIFRPALDLVGPAGALKVILSRNG